MTLIDAARALIARFRDTTAIHDEVAQLEAALILETEIPTAGEQDGEAGAPPAA